MAFYHFLDFTIACFEKSCKPYTVRINGIFDRNHLFYEIEKALVSPKSECYNNSVIVLYPAKAGMITRRN